MNPRTGAYSRVSDIFVEAFDALRPPERIKVSEAAARYRYLDNPGSYTGPWPNDLTPYLVEPMDTLRSRMMSGVVFVGPAQSGKTDGLVLNWLLYGIVVDPMDTILYSPTKTAAQDFSIRRLSRMIRHCPAARDRMLTGRAAGNMLNKHFVNGMMLTLSWPSVAELAGKPVPRCALTDYDRMVEDVDGDGAPYDLAAKRNTTFGAFGMTMAESSPSYPILDPRWMQKTAHEAPPTKGILGLYNRGDRRRWYWPCPRCGEYFAPKWSNLEWDDHADSVNAAATVRMRCPVCAGAIQPYERDEMNQWGVWLAEGQSVKGGQIVGEPRRSEIASFWLNGTAATFTTWQKLVTKFLDAEKEFNRTGSDEALKSFFNTDMGDPYLPKAQALERLPEVLQARAQDLPEKQVPPGVRFLVATIDVQGNRFVVQVHGIGPGAPFDITIVDRFTIHKSERLDDQDEHWPVKPGTYQEDWDLLTDQVIRRTYPLADGSGREMQIKMTFCDSGGRDGTTTNAYNYYRKLRSEGLAGRFQLLKGSPNPERPRAYIDHPDSKKKDRLAAARGDVPVLFLNSNVLKDDLSNRLDSESPGAGMIVFPSWLGDWFYGELCVETRTPKGWEGPRGVRNEAWDLLYYCIGGCVSALLKVELIDWFGAPPGWADEWDRNPLVRKIESQEESVASQQNTVYDLAKLGQLLA